MALARYANRRDANEKEIVQALEAIGCTVWRLDEPVDLLVGRGARNWLLEVKDPSKPRRDRQLTDNQKKFFASWQGQVRKIETAEEAIQVVTESYKND